MATRGKQNTKKPPAKRPPAKKSDLDRRWSLLLFALGLLFVILSLVPGESGWAWVRQNILFGGFGISGWVLGPMLIYWGVLIGMEKPVFQPVIKGSLFMLALSGIVLVFSSIDFMDLSFGEVMAALHESGRGGFGGGVLSAVFGASLLALTGRIAARILLVVIFLVAIMVLAGKTPGDVGRFFYRIGDAIAQRVYGDEEEYDEEEETRAAPARRAPPPVAAPPAPAKSAVPPTTKTNLKMPEVDIPIDGARPASPVPRANTKMWEVDIPLDTPAKAAPSRVDIPLNIPESMARDSRVNIDLGPTGPKSAPGKAGANPVDIGPGGTFGKSALDEANTGNRWRDRQNSGDGEQFGLGDDYQPLVSFGPGAPVDMTKKDDPQEMLLF
ncbi:hypothetical protein LJB76_02890, partial [Clostridia bacterium OttesenSCG-928-O13]|nr:hypothetical protein [Clostridia bacterium OttesenSCG-928-O13]